MNTELVTREPQSVELAPVGGPQTILDIIGKVAMMPNFNVDAMERLNAMMIAQQARDAKREFDQAMAAFQSECPVIVKRKSGAKAAYRYAPLDHIVPLVKELISKHGFSFSITSVVTGKMVKSICTVKHNAGHSEKLEAEVPIDEQNTLQTAPQKYGGAMTYSKRYAFCNAFGILTSDEDTDGGNRPPPPSPRSTPKPVVATQASPVPQTPPVAAPKCTRDELLGLIRDAGAPIHRWTKDMGARAWSVAKPHFEQWIFDELAILVPLDTQSPDQLEQTLTAIKKKLNAP